MEVRIRSVCKGYVAYACSRCLNGSMYWEQDKAYTLPYLKCLLCGAETRQERKFENMREKVQPNRRFEPKIEADGRSEGKNKHNKRGKKPENYGIWQFNQS